jgi:ParB family chromosome partitioning protein
MGQARALLGLETPTAIERLARQAIARELSVRRVEELVRRERAGERSGPASTSAPSPSASARDLGLRLTRAFGTRVEVLEKGAGRGQIAIHYHSLDQLDALLEKLQPS